MNLLKREFVTKPAEKSKPSPGKNPYGIKMIESETSRKDTELIAKRALKEIGINRGQEILDFGCGSGHYTISAALVTGDGGTVYALDKEEGKLEELKKRARERGLKNIEVVKSSGDTNIELEDDSIDVTLLYDIFWYFRLTDPKLSGLLDEVHRVSMTDSLLSVYPKHIGSGDLREKIERTGFKFRDRFSGTLLHEGRPEKGVLLNFKAQSS